MSLKKFLQQLQSAEAIMPKDIVNHSTIPREEPSYAGSFPTGLKDSVKDAIRDSGIEALYTHQAEAMSHVLLGKDVVVVAPTATGKSLCYLAPIYNYMASNRKAHALLVFPMKALANDQRASFERFSGLHDLKNVTSWIYDGDTPQEHRSLLRASPTNLLATNPEMIHLSFLAHHEKWSELYKSLRFIVIDEIHEYRGFFGTNMAYLLRRLLKVSSLYGSNPQVIMCSATVANPMEHTCALAGREMVLVHTDHAGKCEKHFVFVNPDIRDYQYDEILRYRICLAAIACQKLGLSCLIFCPTRKYVERISKKAKHVASENGLPEEEIAPYRSGYTSDERREIESGLKSGKYKIVFSTNALELGIDIGLLDVCIMVGFPENAMSAWQRAGRVGRSIDKEAYVLIYAMRNPIDQYYAMHHELFMNKPLDQLVVDLSNKFIREKHVTCGLYEFGPVLRESDRSVLGDGFYDALSEKRKDFKPIGGRWIPHTQVPIRSSSSGSYSIMLGNTEIGTISGDKVFSEVYLGAIYDHFGSSYRVTQHGTHEIMVEVCSEPHYTKPLRYWSIQRLPSGLISGRRWVTDSLVVTLYFGTILVQEHFSGYVEYDDKTHEAIGRGDVQPVLRQYETKAFWMDLDWHLPPSDIDIYNSVHVLEHAIRNVIPFVIPCDPYDVCGLSQKAGADMTPCLYIYDTIEGGMGVSEKIYHIFGEIIEHGHQLLSSCKCKKGCPKCVQIPRCHEENENLDKKSGLALMAALHALLKKPFERLDLAAGTWR